MPEPICLNKQRLTVASLKTSRRQEKKKKKNPVEVQAQMYKCA